MMSPRMRQFFHFLEVITWSITTILTIICFVFIIYQLYILYIPYWLNLRGETPYLFPEYFYRVYGEKITSLGYEHYGYLVSAVVLSGIAAGYSMSLEKTIINSILNSITLKIISFSISIITVRYSNISQYGELSTHFPLIVSISTFFQKEGFRRCAIKLDNPELSAQVSVFGAICMTVWMSGTLVFFFHNTIHSFASISILWLALLIDIWSEPVLIFKIVNERNLLVRSRADLKATTTRSIVLLFLILYSSDQTLFVFAVSQLVYSVVWFIALDPPKWVWPMSFSYKEWFRPLSELLLMSIQKLFLSEGEKILTLTFFPPESIGKLALVNNVGSHVIRLIFAPLEDICFNALSRKNLTYEKQRKTIQLFVLINLTVGLLGFAFGPSISFFVIHSLYGSQWSRQSDLIELLQFYTSILILFALNGTLEAFYFATADSKSMRKSLVYQWVSFGVLAMTILGSKSVGTISILYGTAASMSVRILFASKSFKNWKDPFHSKTGHILVPIFFAAALLRLVSFELPMVLLIGVLTLIFIAPTIYKLVGNSHVE